jgi:N-acetylmuramoyl-L-alanine amidase
MRIFIDPGHGGLDPGASVNGLIEKDIVLEISLRLAGRLKNLGHLVKISRATDFFLDLSTRAQAANEWLADAFVSVHLNADADEDGPGMPEAKGYEFWIYPGSAQGRKLAGRINDSVALAFPDRRARGIKEANFAVLRLTKMPAVLLELAFIDTVESQRLKDAEVQELLAAAVAKGVHLYSTDLFQGVV